MYIAHDISNDYNDVAVSIFEKEKSVNVSFSSSGLFSFGFEIKDINKLRALANALDAGEGNIREDAVLMSVKNQILTIKKDDLVYSYIANIYLSIEDISRLRTMFLLASPLE